MSVSALVGRAPWGFTYFLSVALAYRISLSMRGHSRLPRLVIPYLTSDMTMFHSIRVAWCAVRNRFPLYMLNGYWSFKIHFRMLWLVYRGLSWLNERAYFIFRIFSRFYRCIMRVSSVMNLGTFVINPESLLLQKNEYEYERPINYEEISNDHSVENFLKTKASKNICRPNV